MTESAAKSSASMKPALTLAVVMVVFFLGGFFTAFMVTGGSVSTGAATDSGSGSGSGSGSDSGTAPPPAPPAPPPTQAPPPSPSLDMQALMDDDPVKGDANAEIVIVEFSDFQCPFCRRFYTQTLPQIESEYIDTGKVKIVYRDFPLNSIHPAAQPSAEAGECADEQGKFWEFHDLVYDKQQEQGVGSVSYGAPELKQWAAEIPGLDTAQFDSCLDSGKYAEEVNADFNAGVAAGVSGTPSFFVGRVDGTGQNLVGAQPFSAFQSVIDSLL